MRFILCLIVLSICYTCVETNKISAKDDPLTWKSMEKYLMYAYSSYCTEDLANWTCWWCKQTDYPLEVVSVLYDNSTNTYGYIGYNDEEIIISWRGTNDFSLINWMTDFEFWEITPYPNITGAYVHYGWFTVYSDIRSSLLPVVMLLSKKFPNKNIVTTGHSLGAALSVLTAIDLVREGYSSEIVEVWNFGQTRVGNQQFASYYDSLVPKTNRIVNQRDLVPHYPFEIMDYYHVSTEIWFPNNVYNFTVCSGGEDINCSDGEYYLDPADHTTYLGFQQTDGHQHGCGN